MSILKQAEAGIPCFRALPGTGDEFSFLLQMAQSIGGYGCLHDGSMKELESENRRLQRMDAEERLKAEIIQEAMVRPSERRTMAKKAVSMKEPASMACCAFTISQTCYRYESELQPENEIIADGLIRLTQNQINRGFGLCFLSLRQVKGFGWNHKRMYHIDRALELNLRIRPKKRLKREKPGTPAVPEAINECWSMD